MIEGESLDHLIPRTYAQQGLQNIHSRENSFQDLLKKQKLPSSGWDDQTIEAFLQQLSLMDSNNFASNTGVGEREGRVFSPLVAKRHFYLAHGIGRSGDIVEVQPKAAGSSVIYKLANKLSEHALQVAGVKKGVECIVFPLATGMSLALCLSALRSRAAEEKKFVLWSRIDQKSCFKSISAAGLTPIVVETALVDGQMTTDVEAMEAVLAQRAHEILCVLSTTSCFAPRQPDAVDKIAELCAKYDVGHVINNAYGLQCEIISKRINRAMLKGRVDAFVQSTDKNFLVPVGGAIVASPAQDFLQLISATYPGRASIAPVLDLFITLLSMGERGYRGLLEERRRLLTVFEPKLRALSDKYNLCMIQSPQNTISFAVGLDSLPKGPKGLSFLGSMLFQRNVSGCRVVPTTSKTSVISNVTFRNWGSHHNEYPQSYFTAACAIGITEAEIDVFIDRLEKTLRKFIKTNSEDVPNSIEQDIHAEHETNNKVDGDL